MKSRPALTPLLALSLSLVACGGGGSDPVEELGSPGRHAVGYRSYDFEYLPEGATAPRRIELSVWYPTAETEGRAPRYFLFTAEGVVLNAAPKDLGPLPVMVFSHGHLSYAESTGYLMEHFASHGWLVVAPTHTGNTFEDGDERLTDIYYLRSMDVSATLDFVRDLPASDPLGGVAGEPVLLSGHSFGGYTGYSVAGAEYAVEALAEVCAGEGRRGYCSTLTPEKEAIFAAGLEDDRFAALVAMAAGDFDLFGPEGVAAVDVPVLQMTAEGDGFPPGSPETDLYWQALDGAADRRVNVVGGTHQTFTDACEIGLGGIDDRLTCSETLTTAEEARIVKTYALAFARRRLLGDEGMDPILDGDTPVHPAVELYLP